MFSFISHWINDTFIYYIPRNFVKLLLILFGRYSFNSWLGDVEMQRSRDRIRLLQSLYVNFRSLPWRQAWKMPIVTYSNLDIQSLNGKIVFDGCEVKPMMVQLGVFQRYRSQGKTRINNKGIIVFHGSGKILRGAELMTYPSATIEIGDSFFIGENAMIFAAEYISIGKSSCISYHSQLCDSDFHFMINVNDGTVRNRTKPIKIGDYNWITNNVSVKKGTITPDHITAAGSYTVLLKDYTKTIPPYSILAGNPAKCLVSGYSRIWKNEKEQIAFLSDYFRKNPQCKNFVIGEDKSYTDYSY